MSAFLMRSGHAHGINFMSLTIYYPARLHGISPDTSVEFADVVHLSAKNEVSLHTVTTVNIVAHTFQ